MSKLKLVSSKKEASLPKKVEDSNCADLVVRRNLSDVVFFAVYRGVIKSIRVIPDNTLGLELIRQDGAVLMVSTLAVTPGEICAGDDVIVGHSLCKDDLTDHPYIANLSRKKIWLGMDEAELRTYHGYQEGAEWEHFVNEVLLPTMFKTSGLQELYVDRIGRFSKHESYKQR